MTLTNNQHILRQLQELDSLTEEQVQAALREQQIEISLTDIDLELTQLIEAGWVEYYGIGDETGLAEEDIVVAYELCNRWWNLKESEREKILVG